MFKKYFWLLLYFLSPLIPIIAIYNSNPGKFSYPIDGITMVLGTSGFVWLTFEFILSARPKFIEITFGLDKFYRFHGTMGLISVLLVFGHQLPMPEGRYYKTIELYGNIAWWTFIGITALGIIFMRNTIILKIKQVSTLKKILTRFELFKYNKQVLIHNLTIVGLIVMFIHVSLTTAVRNHPGVKAVFIAYFAIALLFYIYHKFIKKYIISINDFTVSELVKESDSMWTVKLEPENGNIFDYKPGQFGFITFTDSSIKKEEHPFSISSSPLNKDYVSFTIKELGDFTSQIKNVKPGDKTTIEGPYGVFSYLNYKNEEEIVLIAGGVGITPVLSMLRYMKEKDKDKKVTVLWGVNKPIELICQNEIEEIQKEMKNLNFIPVIASEPSWNGEIGYIDKEKIVRLTNLNGSISKNIGFYLCGPAPMMKSVLKSLKEIGISKKHIHFESFAL